MHTMIMDERLDQFASVQFVVVVRVVHFEVMELQLLLAHLARINGHLGVFLDVPRKRFVVVFVSMNRLAGDFPRTHCRSWASICPGLKPCGG